MLEEKKGCRILVTRRDWCQLWDRAQVQASKQNPETAAPKSFSMCLLITAAGFEQAPQVRTSPLLDW
jgi:hypothetical protein